jgi:hypothetical protein
VRLPPWAQPPKSYPNRHRCMCDYQFPSVCTVRARALGHSFTYHLCRVCLVYEREIRGELTYQQAERWSRRLIAVHLERGDYYVPPPPAPKPTPTRYKRRRCPECRKERRYPIDSVETRCGPCRRSERKRIALDAIPLDVSHVPVQPEAGSL